jgi:hypothetical protein
MHVPKNHNARQSNYEFVSLGLIGFKVVESVRFEHSLMLQKDLVSNLIALKFYKNI